ncbi:MAG TPA: VOC family protein [Methylomirabilota bacterium]|jgi:catechol-2,3-dioxygenase
MSRATPATGLGLTRLQHLVLWVADVERSVRFYRDVLGFEVTKRYPNAAFLKIAGSADDHNLGLFEQAGVAPPDEGVARMYHSAWEVAEITDLVRARERLRAEGALVGSSDHGVSLSLYAKDPDGLEFEIFWTVPGGTPVGTRPLDLDREVAQRGIRME